ncbi:putative reverse transcriptase domain-containing protein [Tanacetum coccineum]|uniref:Reverse transcriptase domain-containing protein n=1 Tax=Tanacetum coccineum TaxID=301880 RepID=A0ABQ4XEP1_9ASTR
MGRGTWYYSLGVFLAIVDAFVRSELKISSWRAARFGVRTYLLGGAIDGSKANGIICNPKLELESSSFTFDLVPLSYESVDVVIGENWLLRHKAEMVCHEKVVKMPWLRKDTLKFTAYAFVLTNAPAVFIELMSGGVRVAREDDRGVTEGREDVREVFQQRGSGAKRKLSRCGRNQIGNEPILALPKGADDFVVYYDARSKDLKACLEKGRSEFDFEAKYHLGKANVDVVPWSRKKE